MSRRLVQLIRVPLVSLSKCVNFNETYSSHAVATQNGGPSGVVMKGKDMNVLTGGASLDATL